MRTGGRTALVTGGSRGIGRAVVERLARDGHAVAFGYRSDRAAAEEVAGAVRAAGGRAEAIRADLARVEEVRALVERADAVLGGLDVVVANAGVVHVAPVVEVTEDDYDAVMAVKARGTFFTLQEAGRRVRDGGRIVAMSSLNTATASPTTAVYSASKAAVEQFVAISAKELGPRGVTVNAVSPGATDTDMLRAANPPEALEAVARMSPLGRLGRPADVADVVASRGSRFGQIV